MKRFEPTTLSIMGTVSSLQFTHLCNILVKWLLKFQKTNLTTPSLAIIPKIIHRLSCSCVLELLDGCPTDSFTEYARIVQ